MNYTFAGFNQRRINLTGPLKGRRLERNQYH